MQGRKTGFLVGGWGGILFAVAAAAGGTNPDRCLPFFDYSKDKVISNVVQPDGSLQKGEVDITPEPIEPNAFNEAVQRACGQFGSKVNPQEVRKLIENFSPDLFKELAREFTGYSDSQLREMIAKVWTGANGFGHVFCGQPQKGKVGGLHFAGRYFELQESGQLCRLTSNLPNEEVLAGSVYTIGVSTPGGIIDRKKGFSVRQSAEDIFFEGARTYLRNCDISAKDRRICISRFYKDGSFGNLFVCTPRVGLITMYPLATRPKDTVDCK